MAAEFEPRAIVNERPLIALARCKEVGPLSAQVGYRPTRQVISEAAIVTLVDLDLSAQQIDGWHRSLRDFSRQMRLYGSLLTIDYQVYLDFLVRGHDLNVRPSGYEPECLYNNKLIIKVFMHTYGPIP